LFGAGAGPAAAQFFHSPRSFRAESIYEEDSGGRLFCRKVFPRTPFQKTPNISAASAGRRSFKAHLQCSERREPHLSRNEREIGTFIINSAPSGQGISWELLTLFRCRAMIAVRASLSLFFLNYAGERFSANEV